MNDNMSNLFTKVNDLKVREYIIMQIKKAIDSGQLKYGDKLPSENELAHDFGVSRNSVREALLVLEFMGLVETRKGSGTEVIVPSQDDFIEKISMYISEGDDLILNLIELRLILETNAARLAAMRSDDEDKAALTAAIEEMNRKLEGQAYINPEEAMGFHNLIAKASKNPFLEYVLNSINNLNKNATKIIYTVPGRPEESLKEHIQIYKAVLNGDPVLAEELMGEHLGKVKSILEGIYCSKDTK